MRSEQLWPRWPRAFPALGLSGQLKQTPEDFRVTELADPVADPAGEHLYLYVQKRNLSTQVVAERIAKNLGLRRSEVGYAGMKDFRAITSQWFSVPIAGSPEIDYGDGVQELRRLRCLKKLRRGQLDGNAFEIRLRRLAGGDDTAVANRFDQLTTEGAPNYFGPQRFGRDNLSQALAWLPFRRRERNGFRRGLHLSVLRSFLFNEVLAARVGQSNWQQCLVGELAPAGPLWGRGRSPAQADVLELESRVLEEHAELLEALEFTGLTQARRPLVLRPQELDWAVKEDVVQLKFVLPPGTYATSLLRELGDFETTS